MPIALSFNPLAHKDLLTVSQLTREEILMLFETAATLKRDYRPFIDALRGRTLVMLFEKPSLRTRVSFEVGMAKLGGAAVYFDHQNTRIGVRETVADYAHNLERWTDCIVARTFSHGTLVSLATETRLPVINALSDLYHPCQGLADLFTIQEHFGGYDGVRIAYVGDGNNVCHSLMQTAAKLGADVTVVTPRGFEPDTEVVHSARSSARGSGCRMDVTTDVAAVAGHHVIYTDTWISMGQEEEKAARVAAFQGYQVDAPMMAAAAPNAVFMHCLPAYRGNEVAADVIDSPRSIVFDQAENRMHVQNALLLHTIGAGQRETS